jgi:hypothetical protein
MAKAAKRKPKTTPVAKAAKPKSTPRPKRKPREKSMTSKDDKDLPHSDKKSGPGATPGTPEKDPKDKPELAPIPGKPGDDPNEKKNTPPPSKQPHTENTIHNRDQDPNHPANKTLSPKADPAPRPVAEGITVPPEELLTEQEKDAVGSGASGDTTAGVGPVAPAAHTTGPVETIEDQGIGPRTPYPTGNPPPPREETTLSQGIWRGDEDGANAPNSARNKNEYHRGDTVADGPNREEAKRQKELDAKRGDHDTRPQPRVGGPQEMAHPPKESGK